MKKIIRPAVFICWFLVAVTLICGAVFNKNQATEIDFNNISGYISQWRLNDSEDITLPYSMQGKYNQTITISTVLDPSIPDGTSIMYMSNYCISRVYAGDTEIGSYGTEKPSPFGYMLGNIRIKIPLPENMNGSELRIEITPVYNQSLELPVVMYGTDYGLKDYVIHHNLWREVAFVFLATIFVLCLCAALFLHAGGAWHSNIGLFYYFSGFIFCFMMWLMCSSDIPQFLTSKNEAVALMSYMSLAVMGIPYIGYCRQIFSTRKSILKKIELSGYIIPFLVSVCYLTDFADPPQLLLLTHVYMVVVVSASFITAIKEWKTNPDSKLLVISIILLMASAALGMLFYYTAPTSGLDAVSFGCGFVMYVFMLLGILVIREIRYLKEKTSMEVYKEMAFSDKLTGCGNRAALDDNIEKAEKNDSETEYKWLTVIMIDLNHLKAVNDLQGHKEGDELICGCAWCLKKAFSECGFVYRLGGDEFTVIMWNKKDSMPQMLKKLDEAISEYNADHKNPVSMALGYSEAKWTSGGSVFQKLFRKADELMYINKKEHHRLEALQKEKDNSTENTN